MKNGEQKRTPEEWALIDKERMIEEREFLKEGAEYKYNEKGSRHLDVTESEKLVDEIESNERRNRAVKIQKQISELGIKPGDKIRLIRYDGAPESDCIFKGFKLLDEEEGGHWKRSHDYQREPREKNKDYDPGTWGKLIVRHPECEEDSARWPYVIEKIEKVE